jgi:predicted nucleic acid-binding protein
LNGWLLDTNVLSEVRRPRCDPHVLAWVEAQAPDSLFVSRVALAEIRFGIECLPLSDPRRTELRAWLDGTLRAWFAHRVLDVTEDVIVAWRRLVQAARGRGTTPPEPDGLIAATAAVHDLRVVTRNIADFAAIGVPLLNPWEAAR